MKYHEREGELGQEKCWFNEIRKREQPWEKPEKKNPGMSVCRLRS